MWQQFLKDYFSFTKKERKGIIFIVCLILLITILPLLFPYFVNVEETNATQFEKEIAQLRADSTSKKYYSGNYDDEYYNDYTPLSKKYSSKAETFFFDPNTASVADWIKLGIKPHTAQTIQKYISKGGKFYKPEDIRKIWGLSPKDAERLIPYISIKKIEKTYPQDDKKEFIEMANHSKWNAIQKVDINSADTTQFIALPGIGSKLSKRIIAFREKLGGFYSIDQLGETYMLPDSTFKKIKPYLVINSKAIKKININSASVEEMKMHPYIRYHIANAIFQYRKQHGSFNSVEEMKKIMLVTDDLYNKASPYLTIE